MTNSFLDKIKAEAAGTAIETMETIEEPIVAEEKAVAPKPEGTGKCLHTFVPPKSPRMNEIDASMESLAKAIILAMSEANISTIEPDIFGPLIAFGGVIPKGFSLYNPSYLDSHYLVLNKSNRGHTVHSIIEEAYHATEAEVIALPLIQETKLVVPVYGNMKSMNAKYLLFSEEEIYNISLPYVKEVRVETDGHERFFMIDVVR